MNSHNINNTLQITRYEPSLFRLFPSPLKVMNTHERVRFLLMFRFGYEIFFLNKEGKHIGYCVISSGGSKRYAFVEPEDKILGPYYICDDERGQRLSEFLIKESMKSLSSKKVWAFVQVGNIASSKILSSLGFEIVAHASYSKITRNLVISQDHADYCVYLLD